ncbi:AraC family transcriptional regulator [Nocardia farcinica]|uniref:AraC family transcriptional regulator n=1 Tax=Nocardia farcinica TaxID=37329 RepID=UPI002456E9C1|nr:AraC family transcriptional regulator [Nocardia farcinica]
MDVLESLLHETRARGAVLCQSRMDPPWGVRFSDGAALTLVAMAQGGCWVRADGHPPVRLDPGDAAIVRGPHPYTLSDSPTTSPRLFVEAADRCTDLDGREVPESAYIGPRVWGDRPDAATVVLTGAYPARADVAERLLAALPRVVRVPAEPDPAPEMALLLREISADRPGQQVMLDRLLDLLLVSTLRCWLDDLGADGPPWYRALGDPVAGPALRAIHDDPAAAWTVAELARRAGVSRAAFARRFTELVGEPPMTYLTGWRVALAADRLRRTDDTLGAIARAVGYSDGYALSAAFTRVKGLRPGEFRRACRGGTDSAHDRVLEPLALG